MAVAWNLLLLYIVYQLARLEYYAENASYFTPLMEEGSGDIFLGGLLFDTSAIIYTNALYILLMLLPWSGKMRRGYQLSCTWLFIIVNSLCLALNLADSVYFQYTLRRTTTTVFSEFSNEENLVVIFGTELFRHWYLLLLFAIVVAALWKLYGMPRADGHGQDGRGTGSRGLHGMQGSGSRGLAGRLGTCVSLLSLILAVPLCVAGIRGGFTTAVRPITISNANQYALRPTDAALVLNTPFSLIRTIGKNVFTVPAYFSDPLELASVYSPIHSGNSGLSVDSVYIRKNVVVLIVESFGREYISALNKTLEGGRYKGYTPCVDSLISRSTTFSHSYCNGRKSIDGMPSILSSIPMFVEPFFLTPSSMNDYTGLAGILAAEGYETAFFHGAQNGSMGFQAFAQKTGFQHYFGRTEYEAAHGTDDFDGTWAIWDEPFLQYYAEEMTSMHEPFMTAVFTASSHHPFVIPEKYSSRFPEGPLEIHQCIRYTDMAIGRFFETVSRQPWFNNTIFVLTSDHTNMSDHPEYQTDLGGFCSPVIIYDPSHPVGKMEDKIAQQIDILPTVLGMMGYQKPYFGFGIDLFNTPAEDTWAVNYLNGIYQYVKYGYVLQFDGDKSKGFYALSDSLMRHNLISNHKDHSSKLKVQNQMELELKAIIQQYMERMTQNRLLP